MVDNFFLTFSLQFTNATTWMDAWIGNVIANVPEVTVCYHEKGTVIDYLSLKTSEIPSEKGIVSADGMVLHHGLKVLWFLHLHCKEERAVYRVKILIILYYLVGIWGLLLLLSS